MMRDPRGEQCRGKRTEGRDVKEEEQPGRSGHCQPAARITYLEGCDDNQEKCEEQWRIEVPAAKELGRRRSCATIGDPDLVLLHGLPDR